MTEETAERVRVVAPRRTYHEQFNGRTGVVVESTARSKLVRLDKKQEPVWFLSSYLEVLG